MTPRLPVLLHGALVLLLGLPALMLTLARPWDTTVGAVIRLQAFAPLGVPLYAVVVVLCLAGAFLQAHGRRTPLLLGALMALIGLGVHLWWFSPQLLGDRPEAAEGARTLTVMTANLYANKGDPTQLVEEAARAQVDVLVVSEITEWALSRMDDAGLAELLPNRIGTPEGGVAGTMVFANERLGTPERLPTAFQGWRVEVGSLTMLAVHPVAPVDPTGPDQWREEHDAILTEAVESGADIVAGDLNAAPDHAVLRALEEAGFRDSAELVNEGWQPTWPANNAGVISWLPPVVRIDHVLVGSELTATASRTMEIDGTDHLAVVAELARR